jgi:ABC-2 type transport system ATP-binding protein
MSASGPALDARDLVKRYGAVTALDRVSLTVAHGELFGVIGPDGGGKTSLFRICATLIVPDAGQARVLGQDVVGDLWALRRRIGYMPGRFSLYPDLSVEENLQFFAAVFGTSIRAAAERIAPIYSQLEPFRARRASALSGGMKQKLALCCALVHAPEILLLDEPTTGVDAVSRREFWDLLGGLKRSGLTVVVSTPYMDEATRCDRVALMQAGRLIAVDAPEAITRTFDRPLVAVRAHDRYRALLALREFPHTRTVYPFGEALHYTDARQEPAGRVGPEVEAFLRGRGFDEVSAREIPASVEDVFMARMGAPAAAAPPGGAR